MVKLDKNYSIEELQEREEFTTIIDDSSSCGKCDNMKLPEDIKPNA